MEEFGRDQGQRLLLDVPGVLFQRQHFELLAENIKNAIDERNFDCAAQIHRWKEAQIRCIVAAEKVQGMEKQRRLGTGHLTHRQGSTEIGESQSRRKSREIKDITHVHRQLRHRHGGDRNLDQLSRGGAPAVSLVERKPSLNEPKRFLRSFMDLLFSELFMK